MGGRDPQPILQRRRIGDGRARRAQAAHRRLEAVPEPLGDARRHFGAEGGDVHGAALAAADYLLATHRGHGHTLAKGADPAAMMCALFGREGGVCGGKGGSMSLTSLDRSCRTPFAANTTRQAVLKMAMSRIETPRSGLPV
ncbi:MAG: hypothetical protein IIA68_05995 [Proteobacteria bacterium]|nr:hypothetical protein [Pseudomonadota bacterium]